MVEASCLSRSCPCIAAVRVFISCSRTVLTVVYVLGCHTTYRPNYYVSNAESTTAIRQYYQGVPDYIEVTQHSYVDLELTRLFRHQMAFAQ